MGILKRQVRRIERKGMRRARVGLPPRRPFIRGLIGRKKWHENLAKQLDKAISILGANRDSLIVGEMKGIRESIKSIEGPMGWMTLNRGVDVKALRDLRRLLERKLIVARSEPLREDEVDVNKAVVKQLDQTLKKIQEKNSSRLDSLKEYTKP